MSEGAHEPAAPSAGFEFWAYVAFAIGLAVAALYVFLGLRLGGRASVVAFSYGPFLLGSLAALVFAFGLLWSILKPPILQRGRLKPLLVLAGALWLCSFPLAYPSSHEGRPSAVPFRLPFEGEARVRWGGDDRRENVYVLTAPRRFGVAFELPAGTPVLAPAAGRTVAIADAFTGEGMALGLEVAPGELLVLDGLSLALPANTLGTGVEAGEPVGHVAADLLAVHLEDGDVPGTGEGIPMSFRGYESDGRRVDRGRPRQGERVEHAGP